MSLSEKTLENIQFMVDEIKKKLNVITDVSIKPEHFTIDNYEGIKEIYEHIATRDKYSVSEIVAILDELKLLKNLQ